MSKEITLTIEELEKEIKQAFIHGQEYDKMIKEDNIADKPIYYVNSRVRHFLKQNKDE